MKKWMLGLLLLAMTVVAFVIQPAFGAVMTGLAMALPAGIDNDDPEILKAEAEKIERKMNKLIDGKIDPLLAKLTEMGEMTPDMIKEIKGYGAKFEALQKQYDELDVKLQKQNVPNQDAPIYDQIMHVVKGMQWTNSWKADKRGGTLDLKGIDLMNTKASTVTRVTDTIPPQFTPFQYVPGRRFHIRDLMPVGQATSNTIWMPYESATTNGIARVAEGSTKPQSDFTPAVVKWPVEKIATWIKFSEEILEDMPQFTSYLTTRWIELLKQAEDVKLLYGTGSSDIKGLTVAATAYTDILADSKVDRYMILDAAVTQCKVAGFFPNYIFLNPVDMMKLRQTRDTTGAPYFLMAMGMNQPMTIGGATIVEHQAVTSGDFLVGDTVAGCQLWDRKAANVKFYDQDDTNAQYNLITAVFEERLALVTYHATAFVFGDFTSALARGSA